MKPIIRKAKVNDLEAIYKLVKELAIYENEPDAVTAALEDYKNDFNEGIFQSLVAELDGIIVGIVIYYMAYSTWKGKMLYLEDFVVNQKYRKIGIGQYLFDALLKEGQVKGARLVKWQVLDWNEPAIAFYKKNKAVIEKNWWSGKVFLSS